MDVAWSRLKSVYPLAAASSSPSRYTCTDDPAENLKQPLIDSDASDSDDDPLGDEEAGLLPRNGSSSKNRAFYSTPPAKHNTRPRNSNSSSGAFFASVEPKFMRSIGRVTALAASAFGSPFVPPAGKSTGTTTTTTSTTALHASTIHSPHTRRMTERVDDATERVLVRLALLTLVGTLLLVLSVAAHAS